MTRRRVFSRSIPIAAVFVGLIVGLHMLARMGLRGPDGISRAELSMWFDDPIVAIATVVRWVGLILAYYLLVIVGLTALAGDRVEHTPLRHVVPAGLWPAIGFMLGVGAVAAPLAVHMSTAPADIATDDAPLQLLEVDGPLTLRYLELVDTHPMTGALPSPEVPKDATPARETWIVEPGDSFWKIAEEDLKDRWQRPELDDRAVAAYWRTLIDANLDRLVEPGNPDLLFPGQELVLPDIPPPST